MSPSVLHKNFPSYEKKKTIFGVRFYQNMKESEETSLRNLSLDQTGQMITSIVIYSS